MISLNWKLIDTIKIDNTAVRKTINNKIEALMLKTGIYNLFSKKDLEEFIYRSTIWNTREQNDNYFIHNTVTEAVYKSQIIEITDTIIVSYYGSHLPFKRLNESREKWEKNNNIKLRMINHQTKGKNRETANLISKCVSDALSDQTIKHIGLGESRTYDLWRWEQIVVRHETFTDQISDSDMNQIFKIMNFKDLTEIDYALEVIKLYWLYLNGLVYEDVDDKTAICVDQLIDFNIGAIQAKEGKSSLDSLFEKYKLKKIEKLIAPTIVPWSI